MAGMKPATFAQKRESGLQRTGQRPLNRRLIAFGACAAIRALERRRAAAPGASQQLLSQLSGRQAKRGRALTTGGRWAGLWVHQGTLCSLALVPRNGTPC